MLPTIRAIYGEHDPTNQNQKKRSAVSAIYGELHQAHRDAKKTLGANRGSRLSEPSMGNLIQQIHIQNPKEQNYASSAPSEGHYGKHRHSYNFRGMTYGIFRKKNNPTKEMRLKPGVLLGCGLRNPCSGTSPPRWMSRYQTRWSCGSVGASASARRRNTSCESLS